MIYVRSTIVGLICVCVASLLTSSVISAYLSAVHHLGMGRVGWNSNFFASPIDWLFTTVMFFGGFVWEFRRIRSRWLTAGARREPLITDLYSGKRKSLPKS